MAGPALSRPRRKLGGESLAGTQRSKTLGAPAPAKSAAARGRTRCGARKRSRSRPCRRLGSAVCGRRSAASQLQPPDCHLENRVSRGRDCNCPPNAVACSTAALTSADYQRAQLGGHLGAPWQLGTARRGAAPDAGRTGARHFEMRVSAVTAGAGAANAARGAAASGAAAPGNKATR